MNANRINFVVYICQFLLNFFELKVGYNADAISNVITGLQTEFANENDSRLALYNQKPGRLPCLMLFKNDTHKTHINAKLSNEKAIEWTRTHVG